MIRTFIGLLGVLTTLVPDRMLDVFEAVAIENPGECTPRPWIGSAIRAEGVLVTVASLLGGRAYAWMMNLTGAFGAVVLLVPQLYREFAKALVYENPEAVEWNEQFTDGVRIIGVVYVLLAVRAFKKRRANPNAND